MIEQHYGGKDGFWKFLMDRDNEGCLLGCSIKGNGKVGQLMIDGTNTGLILNHAYGINDIMEITDKEDPKRPLRIMRLRNPWGHTEWEGAWSENSKEFAKYESVIQEYVDDLAPDERFPLRSNDGTFFMHYSDWKEIFSTLFLNIDFPEDWTGVRFDSAWTSVNSGGLPNTYTKDVLERYAKNPQFLIRPKDDMTMMFSMTQTGGRLPLINSNPDHPRNMTYYSYPFNETLIYANVALFRLPFGQRYLTAFDKDKLVSISPIKRERENSCRVKLLGGETYVIVPSCEIAGNLGKVYLSIYFNQMFRDVEVKRVFHPLDTNEAKDEVLPYFIPEEAEKSGACPTWKLELVRAMLPYMITDEDKGAPMDSSDG
jgi:hypothetical protein